MDRILLTLACSAVACSADPAPVGDWTLALAPHTHPNQAVFADGPRVKLVLQRTSGDLVVDLGAVEAGGSAVAEGLPPADELADLTGIALSVEQPGGPDDAVDVTRAQAWGQTPVTGLAPGAALSVELLVSELASIGDLGALGESQRRQLSGVALVPPGRVYLFGGGDTLSTGTDDVFALSALSAGAPWSVQRIGAIPADGTTPAPRLGLTATPITVDDAPMVFVAGGRDTWYSVADNSPDWWLFDPETETFVDHGQLDLGRAEHGALRLRDGRVLLYGGWTGETGANDGSGELWDPATRRGQEVALALSETGYMVGELGDAGVLACGGLFITGNVASVVDGCRIMNLQGITRDVAPLPIPLAHAAMAPIGEGQVLVTGGFTGEGNVVAGEPITASVEAFLYDVNADAWLEVAPLNAPRSSHAAVALSDGAVLLIGGVASDAPISSPEDAVSCPERYDPRTATFTLLNEQCGTWGAGAQPGVSAWPGLGAVVSEGFLVQGEPGGTLGMIGLLP